MIRTLMTLAAIASRIVRLQTMVNWEPPNHVPPTSGQDKPSDLAYFTLICGIGAWFFLPVIAALVGVIVGWVELGKIKKGSSPDAGKTLTQVGFYLSLAQILLTVLGGCAFVAFYFGLFALLFGGAALSEATAP